MLNEKIPEMARAFDSDRLVLTLSLSKALSLFLYPYLLPLIRCYRLGMSDGEMSASVFKRMAKLGTCEVRSTTFAL